MTGPINIHIQPGNKVVLVDGGIQLLVNHCPILSVLSRTYCSHTENSSELYLSLNFPILEKKEGRNSEEIAEVSFFLKTQTDLVKVPEKPVLIIGDSTDEGH